MAARIPKPPAPFSLADLESAFTALAISTSVPPKPNKLGYVSIPGQTVLSFSKLSTFHTCPREFQLKELQEKAKRSSSIDTSFGHALAAGIQALWRYDCIEKATLSLCQAWDYEAFEDIWGKKKYKSIYMAIEALQNYFNFIYQELRNDWQYAELNLKSDELLFFIQVNDSYNFQGHIDLILQHRRTGQLQVVEIKTKGAGHIAAHWQNSMQTKGYFAVLNLLAKRLGISLSPSVCYLCFAATAACLRIEDSFGFTLFNFDQPLLGSDFVLNLIQDTEVIDMYSKDEHFPMRGSQCVRFNYPCQFFGACNDPKEVAAIAEGTYEALSLEDCDIIATLQEVAESYLTVVEIEEI